MISNDERRRAAENLWVLSETAHPDWPRLCEAVGERARGAAVSKLADLIDPGESCDRAALLALADELGEPTCTLDVEQIARRIRAACGVTTEQGGAGRSRSESGVRPGPADVDGYIAEIQAERIDDLEAESTERAHLLLEWRDFALAAHIAAMEQGLRQLGIEPSDYKRNPIGIKLAAERAAERVMPEVVDADGVPIKVGDTIHDICDGPTRGDEWRVYRDGDGDLMMVADEGTPTEFRMQVMAPQNYSHTKPDTWDDLWQDLATIVTDCYDYCRERHIDTDVGVCVEDLVANDFIDRCRRLAGVEL